MKNDRVVWPVLFAAVQLILSAAVFIVVSIGWRYPLNILPGLWLLVSLQTYGLTVWSFRLGKAWH